jgi:LysM repeat protein
MAQATSGSYYTVQPGDTLSAIAQQAYGNANQWQKIYNVNTQVIGNDPDRISPGEMLYIPLLSSSKPVPGSYYSVQPGDTLSGIAQQAYSNANQWQIIYKANTQVIGSDPNRINPGEEIYIPLINKTCTVTSSIGLRTRAAPNTRSVILNVFPQGTVLTFFEVVNGENVEGNPRWGHSDQGYYFWLGGTDHPNG